jgi:hypothetical protein
MVYIFGVQITPQMESYILSSIDHAEFDKSYLPGALLLAEISTDMKI